SLPPRIRACRSALLQSRYCPAEVTVSTGGTVQLQPVSEDEQNLRYSEQDAKTTPSAPGTWRIGHVVDDRLRWRRHADAGRPRPAAVGRHRRRLYPARRGLAERLGVR